MRTVPYHGLIGKLLYLVIVTPQSGHRMVKDSFSFSVEADHGGKNPEYSQCYYEIHSTYETKEILAAYLICIAGGLGCHHDAGRMETSSHVHATKMEQNIQEDINKNWRM